LKKANSALSSQEMSDIGFAVAGVAPEACPEHCLVLPGELGTHQGGQVGIATGRQDLISLIGVCDCGFSRRRNIDLAG